MTSPPTVLTFGEALVGVKVVALLNTTEARSLT
jgi:hypothetical protein